MRRDSPGIMARRAPVDPEGPPAEDRRARAPSEGDLGTLRRIERRLEAVREDLARLNARPDPRPSATGWTAGDPAEHARDPRPVPGSVPQTRPVWSSAHEVRPPGWASEARGHSIRRATLRPEPRYPVELYRIDEVPGLSPYDARRLHRAGIHVVDELLEADLADLSRRVGVPPADLLAWRRLGELVRLDGIGPHRAEALVALGITEVEDLALAEPELLARRMVERAKTKGEPLEAVDMLERTLPAWTHHIVAAARTAGGHRGGRSVRSTR